MAKHYGVMRDLMDAQLRSRDGLDLARVADVEAEWTDAGELVLRDLVCGPEALMRRVSSRLKRPGRFLFRGRFDKRIPLADIDRMDGLEIQLKRDAEAYEVGASERWLVSHLLRFIPGFGR
jgi:hypothetical protein